MLVIRGYIGICVCEKDRLRGVSNKGIHRDVCVCQRDRLGGASGNGRHRDLCVCSREIG